MSTTVSKAAATADTPAQASSSSDALPPFVIRASSSRPSTSKNTTTSSKRRLKGCNTPSRLVHYSGEVHPSSSSSRLSLYAPTFTKDDMDVDQDDMDAVEEEDQDVKIAVAGASIASSHVFMKGHGTFLSANSDEILSSMCGTVERVNKLISVRPARSRYAAEVGDLVIGRITEVGPKRWKVDINAKTDSALQLSSINLPGGIQRRKVESDELQMRNFFQENDLLVAEVQMMFQDNSSALHTRSLRYGKLKNGVLVTASPNLIQRLKSHFVHLNDDNLSLNIDLIIGLNGYIWIAKHFPYHQPSNSSSGNNEGLAGSGVGMDIDATYSDQNDADLSVELRRQIRRVAKCIHILDAYHHPISDVTIHSLVDISVAYVGHILQQTEQQDWHRDANLTSLMMEQLRSGSNLAE
ncbi:related to RRP4-3`-5` exoribonuclease [Sporisorium scitamineum]|uniref:Related to RRP4-3`-5` exoribonuclease n=1 Tax=Sporisorium scitamineum TaxID=49012 RepID=A0A127Z6Z3_9BASI|nr:related to RRP4-3`-5` exoribonuclease [Sporisorium scitamineum]